MAKVIGTIESLKSLKKELNEKGVTRFTSVKEINDFLSNYSLEKNTILQNTTEELEKKFIDTSTDLEQKIQNKSIIIDIKTEKLNKKILELNEFIQFIERNENKNFIKKIIDYVRLFKSKRELNFITKNKYNLINSSVDSLIPLIEKDEIFIQEYRTNKQNLIKSKARPKIIKLEITRRIIENSKNLIAGAIGENLVVKEIKKLSNDFVLINDFKLTFNPPIFYKKKNERIHSIQIDHLLISKAGIFIIETKNWSKSSVDSISLRSPIEQISRFNFALFIFLNKNIKLYHHWGVKTIPIKNVIVMIKNKPLGNFKFVEIKLLSELNNYINSCEIVFTKSELSKIVHKLTSVNNS